MTAPTLTPHARITGKARTTLIKEVAKQYRGGMSIRELAETHGRSYGSIHKMLTESGVKMRTRGGSPRGRTRAKKSA